MSETCSICQRSFTTLRGLRIHQGAMHKKDDSKQEKKTKPVITNQTQTHTKQQTNNTTTTRTQNIYINMEEDNVDLSSLLQTILEVVNNKSLSGEDLAKELSERIGGNVQVL